MRKSVTITFFICIVGLVALATVLEPGKPVPNFVFEKPAKMVRIIEGDTFVVQCDNDYLVRIRPASVGAPEICNCKSVEKFQHSCQVNRILETCEDISI